jgi:hypothetical protein
MPKTLSFSIKTIPNRSRARWVDSLPPRHSTNAGSHRTVARFRYELRRPESDFLRDGILQCELNRHSELPDSLFFRGRVAAVLAHGLVKESEVPKRESTRDQRKGKFELDPERTFRSKSHKSKKTRNHRRGRYPSSSLLRRQTAPSRRSGKSTRGGSRRSQIDSSKNYPWLESTSIGKADRHQCVGNLPPRRRKL